MIDTQAVTRSLPLVASVLGRKYGVKVEISGSDAYTNGQTIHLPALPLDIPDTFLALARGYLDHEAAHVRDTDFHALKQAGLSPLEMHVWNTIEDWRVENRLAEIFPGCRGNFNWLIKHIFGSGQPNCAAPSAADIVNWILLHVRCWDVPELSGARDSLAAQVDSQFPGVRGQIEFILRNVRRNCRTTQDAVNAAREIVRVLEQVAKREQPEAAQNEPEAGEQDATTSEDVPGAGEEGGDSSESDSGRQEGASSKDAPEADEQNTADNHSKPDNTPGKHSQGLGEDTSPSQQGSEEGTDSEQGAGSDLTKEARQELGALLEAGEDELPPTLGSILSATLEDASRQDAAQNTITVAVQTTKHASPFSDDDIQDATRTSVALRTRLSALLQTAVEVRTALGRRGRLDTRSLHRVAVSDPRVFRRNQDRQGINTAVHVLLDCSGSMVRKIRLACTACYALGKALEAMGISVAITAFPADQLPDGSYTTLAPMVRHGQRVHACLDLSPAGGTPMGEALWWTMQDMLTLKENRKIILIVTDGSPDSIECAVEAITVAEATGFEVYGIGIGSDCIASLLPRNSRTIQNLVELSPAMFGVLQQALIS
jgi:cobalamin biosynthesis protein CobT